MLYTLCCCALTLHYYYLFLNNNGDANWIAGSYITVLAVGTTLGGILTLACYSVFVFIASIFVAFHSETMMAVSLPGMFTILILINLIAFIRHKAEQERSHRVAMEEERAVSDAVNHAKVLFLANMSHELLTPLTTIIGFSEIVYEAPELRPESKNFLLRVQTSANHLLEMVRQILTLTKNDVEQAQGEELIDIRNVINREVEKQKLECERKGLTLNLSFFGDASTLVTMHRLHLQRILESVLNNAIKFTQKGGIDILVKTSPSIINSYTDLEITVRDTGIGIAKSNWEKCFNSFTQVQNEFNRSYGGSGIGLTIARKLARAMGGDVEIKESELDLGTTIRIFLKARLS